VKVVCHGPQGFLCLESLQHGAASLVTLPIFLLQECCKGIAFVSQITVFALQLLLDLVGIIILVSHDGPVPSQAFILKGQLRHLSHQRLVLPCNGGAAAAARQVMEYLGGLVGCMSAVWALGRTVAQLCSCDIIVVHHLQQARGTCSAGTWRRAEELDFGKQGLMKLPQSSYGCMLVGWRTESRSFLGRASCVLAGALYLVSKALSKAKLYLKASHAFLNRLQGHTELHAPCPRKQAE